MEAKHGDPDVEDVFDPAKHDDLARAVAQLSPAEAVFFLNRLEAAVTKRKVQLTGYLIAMVVWLASMVGALVYFGSHDGFVGWVFLVPFALVGLVLWVFGWWSEKVAEAVRIRPPEERAAARERAADRERAAAREPK